MWLQGAQINNCSSVLLKLAAKLHACIHAWSQLSERTGCTFLFILSLSFPPFKTAIRETTEHLLGQTDTHNRRTDRQTNGGWKVPAVICASASLRELLSGRCLFCIIRNIAEKKYIPQINTYNLVCLCQKRKKPWKSCGHLLLVDLQMSI